ncbi:MAG TPA: RNA polymerase sigma factor [Xanthomonadaceae bacterium]|nr:RNA polymerase sigma factor [Xanthomonadaceae bacterium]
MSEDVRQQIIALLPRLRRFALGLTGSRDDADDLVQAACERALSRLHQWQPDTRLDSWMFRIVKTIWIDQWRTNRARGEHVDLDSIEPPAGSNGRHVTEARNTLEVVCRAMERLPDEQRLVLTLVSVDGLSYEEAAAVLEVPVGTVMSRLTRARRRLYELVENKPATLARGRN